MSIDLDEVGASPRVTTSGGPAVRIGLHLPGGRPGTDDTRACIRESFLAVNRCWPTEYAPSNARSHPGP